MRSVYCLICSHGAKVELSHGRTVSGQPRFRTDGAPSMSSWKGCGWWPLQAINTLTRRRRFVYIIMMRVDAPEHEVQPKKSTLTYLKINYHRMRKWVTWCIKGECIMIVYLYRRDQTNPLLIYVFLNAYRLVCSCRTLVFFARGSSISQWSREHIIISSMMPLRSRRI